MKTLFLSPDYRCNEKCAFCPCAINAREYNPLRLDEMQCAINKAIDEIGIEMVLISGGEPTLCPDVLPLIDYIKGKELKFGVLSNSLKFASKIYLDKFIAGAGTDFELTTAFHSCKPENHDAITRVPNSFKKSLEGLSALISKGVKVTVKYNINNLTYKELPAYVDWVFSTFPDNVPWVLCNIDVCGVAEDNKDMTAVPFNISKPYLEQALDKVIEYYKNGSHRVVRIFNTPLCCIDPYYWSFLQRSESEENVSAMYLPYKEGEKNELQLNVKGDGGANFKPCEECQLRSQCPGTWSRTGEIYGDEVFNPFK